MGKRILVVDDDPAIARLIEFNLKLVGFEVHCVYSGTDVFDALGSFKPSLIVLDLMLPGLDGVQVCRKLRERNNTVPVIMLTALSDLSDKIVGLDNGADDYMTKPFSPQELISRINSILRRAELFAVTEADEQPVQIGDIRIVPGQREVSVQGRAVELTPKEYDLLMFMCKHRGKILSRQQLLYGVWDYHFFEDTRIVDVHISHLRDKLEVNSREPEYIVTVRNVGYRLKEQPRRQPPA